MVLRAWLDAGSKSRWSLHPAQGCEGTSYPWVTVCKSFPTALRLMICYTMTQGRRWRANLGLEVAIPLGLVFGSPFPFIHAVRRRFW